MSEKNLVQEEIDKAERACEQAVKDTPAEYHGFITFIRQNKRVGTRQNPQYASIRLPYMQVDGRVKMARDDHEEVAAQLDFSTSFETIGDQIVCTAVVSSSIKGSVTAHARVFLGGSGVDSTNPLENAETSAIGRALGFLGYGLYGTGIASAEEVTEAIRAKEGADRSEDTGRQAKLTQTADREPKTNNNTEVASDKQIGYLTSLMAQHGVPPGNAHDILDAIHPDGVPKKSATEYIDRMKAEGCLPDRIFGQLMMRMREEAGVEKETLVDYMMSNYETNTVNGLSKTAQLDLIDWLSGQDDIPGPKADNRKKWDAMIMAVSGELDIEEHEIHAFILSGTGCRKVYDMTDANLEWFAGWSLDKWREELTNG